MVRSSEAVIKNRGLAVLSLAPVATQRPSVVQSRAFSKSVWPSHSTTSSGFWERSTILSAGELVANASLSKFGPTYLMSAIVPWLPAMTRTEGKTPFWSSRSTSTIVWSEKTSSTESRPWSSSKTSITLSSSVVSNGTFVVATNFSRSMSQTFMIPYWPAVYTNSLPSTSKNPQASTDCETGTVFTSFHDFVLYIITTLSLPLVMK
ncbi:hypothetical protein OGAPHI_001168 [Ogataea philodendri]|uniref:Uncharacterized protein n=1 Tax=Ogataea philodendri TaxID=1378263 RepID=A0A9P8T8U1_9ASCO|nr:uncharacterized protein OGAPHI_001168 [Ogataea philodendri]KAH3670653.1 hypothetical protein OGAPHI_001168 [Ogataea philodendri]